MDTRRDVRVANPFVLFGRVFRQLSAASPVTHVVFNQGLEINALSYVILTADLPCGYTGLAGVRDRFFVLCQ